jgi:RNA polymerase sigma-70 factor, ECF subfamily
MPDKRIKSKENREFVVIPGRAQPPDSLAREAMTSPEALEELCDHYIPKIYNYILKRVGKVHDAEDVTSIVFEKAISNLGSFDSRKASFATWLYRIAANAVTDFYRSRGRRKETHLEDDRVTGKQASGGEIERLDLYLVMVELIEELPPKYKESVTLRYFAGLKVQEVAEVLNITESAASKRILRGLAELRKLAGGGPLEEML